MDITKIILPFGTSILIGALIGLEREKSKQQSKNISQIGIRTSILISIFGFVSGFLGQQISPLIFFSSLLSLIILIISSYILLFIRHSRLGITTEITTILIFLFGAMCSYQMTQLAVILTIIVALTLSLRHYLHKTIANISEIEIYDTIKFAIIAFIILPFLPNQSFDNQIFSTFLPEISSANSAGVNVINPYQIWLLIVFVSGISFLGYILVKALGKKVGISITGLLGGFYSSTASSLTLADKSKKTSGKNLSPYVSGIILSIGASFIKMFIFIRTLNEELFLRLFLPLSIMSLFLIGVGFFIMLKKSKVDKKEQKTVASTREIETPFKLTKAIKLGGFIVGALLIAKISLAYAEIELYYLFAILTSVFSIADPFVVSTSALAGTVFGIETAKNIILMIIYLNAIQKVAIVYIFGNKKMVRPLLYVFAGFSLVTAIAFIYL